MRQGQAEITPAAELKQRQSWPLWRTYLLTVVMLAVVVPIWVRSDTPAWDTGVYMTAVHSLQAGHDPYEDATAVQKLLHSRNPGAPSLNGPFSYVYSPITLPLLKVFGWLPLWLGAALYALAYLGGVLAEIGVGFSAMRPAERRVFVYVAPLAVFFPGLLASDNILSGNIAYLLYPAALLAALHAWRSGRWAWFYAAVILASCFKAPMLSLVIIPVLSARRQWIAAGATGAVGLGLFAMQPLVWPSLFRNYLQAVELQFSINRDFGSSPSGLFGGYLYDHHIPYLPWTYFFYLLFAIPVFGMLLWLSRRYLAGRFDLQDWIPVLLVGVILLNPRLMEYDVAPIALPLALLGWRFFRALMDWKAAAITCVALFLGLNILAYASWGTWKLVEGPLLVCLFAAGAWRLLRATPVSGAREQVGRHLLLTRA